MTDQHPTWRSIEKDLRRRDRAPWVPVVVIFTIAAIFGGVLALGVGLYRDWAREERDAYESLVEGEVEDRFNAEYVQRISLDVRTFRTTGFRGAVNTHQLTYVSIDGTDRPDCVLWLTEKDKPSTWELRCSDDPQPTRR